MMNVVNTQQSTDRSRAAVWRTLNDKQRLRLMNAVASADRQVEQPLREANIAARKLAKFGLMQEGSHGWTPTTEGRELALWADGEGYALHAVHDWHFTEPEAAVGPEPSVRPDQLIKLVDEGLRAREIAERLSVGVDSVYRAARRCGVAIPRDTEHLPRKIDLGRLDELAAAGKYAAQIADELGVSPEGVRSAAGRYGIALPRRPPAERPRREPYPWPDAWTADQCAEAWGVAAATWRSYVYAGEAPAPLPGKDEQRRSRWDPETVKAAYVAWPGRQRVRTSPRARDEIARRLSGMWLARRDERRPLTKELRELLDELMRTYHVS